jgi:hypothetical protein
MARRRRQIVARNRKLFVPKISIHKLRRKELRAQFKKTNILWGVEGVFLFSIIFIIFMLPPENYLVVLALLALISISVAIPVFITLNNIRRSVFAGLTISGILGFRALGVGNLFNIILLIGAAIVFEFYFTKSVD